MTDASEPESGGGRSAGRSKASKPGPSYAAIGLLKETMQAATGRKPGDASKAVLEHESNNSSSRALSGELSCNFRSFSMKSDLQQRTGPTKENVLLRAELELLRGQHAELAARLQLAEGQLGQHNRQLLHSRSSSGHQQELSSTRDGLQEADAKNGSVQCLAESAVSKLEVERMRGTLQAVLLQPEEVEAAALQCAWLAHYWELAQQFGLYPEVAASRAAYWRALAPPTSAIVESARHVCAALQQRKEQALCGHGSINSSSTASPEWLSRAAGTGMFPISPHSTAADLVDIERGARQLQELGLEAAVMAALAQQAAARRTTLRLPPARQEGCGLQLLAVLLSPEEASELQLQQAYLAYLWGRAALMGVEPQVSVPRAEQWCCRMDKQPSVRDFQDVRQGFQELRVLGVEQQMWQKRHSGSKPLLPLADGPSCAAGDETSSIAATAAALLATARAEAAAAAATVAGTSGEAAAGSANSPAHNEAEVADDLHLSPSLLPVAAVEVTGSTASDSLCAAKQSIQINFGIMSLPALSFPGSAAAGGVPVSKASKAAGLRTS